MGVLGSLVGGTIGAVFDAAGQWVASGAVWLLTQVGHALSATTSIDLGAVWFTRNEGVMASIAGAVVLPMICCSAILAVYRQDVSVLVRSFLVKLPLALLFAGLAVELVRLSMAVTDNLSGRVLEAGGVEADRVLAPVSSFLTLASVASPGGVPAFVVFISALLVAMASLMLWLELVVRSAAIAAATLFLPLALAGLVWPSVSHWCRRLADTIAALVLSKLVIAAVLALAAGALAGAVTGGSGDTSGGFATAMTGLALLLVATSAPFVLLRLVPAVEAGAVLQLENVRHRLQHSATAPVRIGSLAAQMAGSAGMLNGQPTSASGLGGLPGDSPLTGGPGPGASSGGDVAGIPMLEGEPGGWERLTARMNEVLATTTPGGRSPEAAEPDVKHLGRPDSAAPAGETG